MTQTGNADWQFLSHQWGPSAPAYAGGSKIEFKTDKCMNAGDSCNTITFSATNHIGTHFDFPRHFDPEGKCLSNYKAGQFVFKNVICLWFDQLPKGSLIDHHMVAEKFEEFFGNLHQTDFLLVRTGSAAWRQKDDFWNNGIGIAEGVGDFLRQTLPNLTGVGLDTISISSFKHREVGRAVHREFLCYREKPLLIIEDMNLEPLAKIRRLEMVALPLMIEEADGAPCSIIGRAR